MFKRYKIYETNPEKSYCKFCTEPYNEKNPCDEHRPNCPIKNEKVWVINGEQNNIEYW